MINVNHKQIFGKGSYGTYFKLTSKTGVKIISKSYRKNPKDLILGLKNEDLNKVVQEATIGKIFDEKFTKGLCVVKYNKKFYLGILMKHEESVTAKYFSKKQKGRSVFVSSKNKITLDVKDLDTHEKNKTLHIWMKNQLWEKKIICTDENKDNILVKNNKKLAIVDFDPSFNHFHGLKSDYYIVKNQIVRDFKTKNKKLLKTAKVF